MPCRMQVHVLLFVLLTTTAETLPAGIIAGRKTTADSCSNDSLSFPQNNMKKKGRHRHPTRTGSRWVVCRNGYWHIQSLNWRKLRWLELSRQTFLSTKIIRSYECKCPQIILILRCVRWFYLTLCPQRKQDLLNVNRCFGGKYHLHLHGGNQLINCEISDCCHLLWSVCWPTFGGINHLLLYVGSLLGWFSTLNIELIRSSETSVYVPSTRRYIPEDGNVRNYSCKNLKSYKIYRS
jgi:hypothetical protein